MLSALLVLVSDVSLGTETRAQWTTMHFAGMLISRTRDSVVTDVALNFEESKLIFKRVGRVVLTIFLMPSTAGPFFGNAERARSQRFTLNGLQAWASLKNGTSRWEIEGPPPCGGGRLLLIFRHSDLTAAHMAATLRPDATCRKLM